MQDKLKCAVYTRVSTDNQAEVEFNSCEAQEAKIRAFISSQENMEVYRVYSDPGFTGANTGRPALNAMLADIAQNKINLVISYKIDRLTRSPKDFYQLIELFEKHKVDFISVTERFDTSTPSGRLLRNIMLTFAQFERELASERTKDKMMQRVQKGMWNGGLTPFGYKVENKKLVINEDEAQHVRTIYNDHISGLPMAKSAKMAGISKSRAYSVLRNPVYAGKMKYAGSLWQGNHPPIISEETFQLAQSKHQKARRTLRLYRDYPLAGLIKCAECNSFMSPSHTNKRKNGKLTRYYYYRCTKTTKRDWNACATRQVSADRLEKYVFENLERIASDRQYIDNLIFRLDSSENTGENSRAAGRIGLEPTDLCSEPLKISGEILAQTLGRFLKTLPLKKGIEKNLWAKKFIQRISYSPAEIRLNLNYFQDSSRAQNPVPESTKPESVLLSGFSENKFAGLKLAPHSLALRTIEVILPNPIHACKKKNL